jgi:hypothetical protein
MLHRCSRRQEVCAGVFADGCENHPHTSPHSPSAACPSCQRARSCHQTFNTPKPTTYRAVKTMHNNMYAAQVLAWRTRRQAVCAGVLVDGCKNNHHTPPHSPSAACPSCQQARSCHQTVNTPKPTTSCAVKTIHKKIVEYRDWLVWILP